MKTILAPFILRRLKEEVATELIAKRHEKLIVGMASKQADAYARAVDAAREERARQNAGTDAEPSDAKVKALFTHLRKIANHPLLVRSRYDEDAVDQIVSACHRRGVFGNEASVDRVREHVSGLSDFDLHQLCVDAQTMGSLRHLALPSSAVADSGKTARLLELCDELRAKGSRPLIFSQWKIVLDILEWAMRERGHAFVRLDGSTNVEERQRICDAFNAEGSDLFAFLLSTRGRPGSQSRRRRRGGDPRLRLQPADRSTGGGSRASSGSDAAGHRVSPRHRGHGGRTHRQHRREKIRPRRRHPLGREGDGGGGKSRHALHHPKSLALTEGGSRKSSW